VPLGIGVPVSSRPFISLIGMWSRRMAASVVLRGSVYIAKL